MMLSHITFECPLEISEGAISILRVENQRQLSEYISELKQQLDGNEGRFTLSEGGKELDISQWVCMVIDIFSIDVNERSILNKLYAKVNAEAYNEHNYTFTSELMSHMERYICNIARQQPFPITFSEGMDLAGVFKLANFRFMLSEDSVLERICDFITISANYTKPKVFIFVNLKCFLSKDELEQLYLFASYGKHKLLLIEGVSSDTISSEKIRIIDVDLCEIDLEIR